MPFSPILPQFVSYTVPSLKSDFWYTSKLEMKKLYMIFILNNYMKKKVIPKGGLLTQRLNKEVLM